jgi:hypothetical protein
VSSVIFLGLDVCSRHGVLPIWWCGILMQAEVLMLQSSLALLLHYLLLNMFRMLVNPSSGTCDVFVDLFYGLYCSGSLCVVVTVWFGWGGLVSLCRLQHTSNQSNTTHEITQQISRKLLKMDLLTFETCWSLNNEKKSKWHQVGLSLFNYQHNVRSNKHNEYRFPPGTTPNPL